MSAVAVFTAGVLTFLSPCVLPLIPIYLSLFSDGEVTSNKRFRVLGASLLFSLGFTIVFSLMGLSASIIGRFIATNRELLQQIAGIAILLLGLRFLSWLRIPYLDDGSSAGIGKIRTRFHLVNAFLLGVFFAFAFTPCVGSVLGAVLTYTSLSTSDALVGMSYLILYSAGFALPLILVSAVMGPALAVLHRIKRFIPVFEKITGVLLIVTGFLIATDRLGLLDYAMSTEPPQLGHVLDSNAETASHGATCDVESNQQQTCSTQHMPVLYEFFSHKCPICLQMMPIVNALKAECSGKQIEIRQVDVRTSAGKDLARRYNITGIPVFLFLDKNGAEFARLVGYQEMDKLRSVVSMLIGEECRSYRQLPELLP